MSTFPLAENGEMAIPDDSLRATPESASPFISRPWSLLEFFAHLLPFESYSTFSIFMQNTLRKFWE
jgi:hypothetical protein